jgi:hypothetical protein
MTKQEAFNLYQNISTNLSNLTGSKFAYGISRNINILKAEIEALQKAGLDYETKRLELAAKYSKKDSDGQPVLINNQFQLEDSVGFVNSLEKLKLENKEYFDLLAQESDFKPYKIKAEDLPNNITVSQTNMISSLLDE